jgi:hypothetical protein
LSGGINILFRCLHVGAACLDSLLRDYEIIGGDNTSSLCGILQMIAGRFIGGEPILYRTDDSETREYARRELKFKT